MALDSASLFDYKKPVTSNTDTGDAGQPAPIDHEEEDT
jgi:hypothetical protein